MDYQWKKWEKYIRWKIENTPGGFKKNFLFNKSFPIIRGKIFIYFSYKQHIYHFLKCIEHFQFSHYTAWTVGLIIDMEVIVYYFSFCQQTPYWAHALLINVGS